MGDPSHLYPRLLEPALLDRLGRSPVVVVTGARQVGKTTLVRSLPRRFLTLDSLTTLDQARREPEALVEEREPITVDEVQRAPDLLIAIKRAVDADRRRGRFLLTGSANLLLRRDVGESLAGRAVYLVLRPLMEREKRRSVPRRRGGSSSKPSHPRQRCTPSIRRARSTGALRPW